MASTQKPLSFSLGPLNTKYILDLVAAQKLVNSRYTRSIYMDDLITHLRTKAKPVKKAKAELEVAPAYPLDLNLEAWDKWIAFRKMAKFKAYKSSAPMNKLAKMGNPDEQMLIVQNSIDAEYQGLFALKGNNNGHQKASTKLSAYERAREANNEYRQPDEREVVMGTDGGHLGRAVDEGEGRATIEHVGDGTFIDYE